MGETISPGSDTPALLPDRDGALAKDSGGSSDAVDTEHQMQAPNESHTNGDNDAPGDMLLEHTKAFENDVPGSTPALLPDHDGALAEDFGGSSDAIDTKHQTKAPNESHTNGDNDAPGDMPLEHAKAFENDVPGSSRDHNSVTAEDGAPGDMPLEHPKEFKNGVKALENDIPGSSRDHNSVTAEDTSDDILDSRRRMTRSNKRPAQDATIAGRNSKKRHM